MTFPPADESILRLWRGFPIDASPRPVVLLDEPVRIGAGGFVDGDAKMAWLAASVGADVPLPDGLLDRITEGNSAVVTPALTITAVEPVEHEFFCDRGLRALPAFPVTVTGLRQPCAVLDPRVECWWPPPAGLTREHHLSPRGDAMIDTDDRTIEFPASGGVMTVFERAEFDEYPMCVVGHVITSRRRSSAVAPAGTRSGVAAVRIRSSVTGRLAEPLGARVLLHPSGLPVAVLPAGTNANVPRHQRRRRG